jgi:hypothetical protein
LRAGESNEEERGGGFSIGLDNTDVLFGGLLKGTPFEAFLGFLIRIIEGIIKTFLSVGVSKSTRESEGESRLVDVGLDLSRPDVQCAYDKAMAGDWSMLEKMGRMGDPGVALERSIFTEICERALPLAMHGFGMQLDHESAETLKSSDVVTAFGVYDVDSDEDKNFRETGGMFKKSSYTVTDYNRTVKAQDGSDLGGLKGEENWLTWSHQKSDVFTSDEEVIEASTLASYLLQGEEREMLGAYCDAISGLADRRKLWVGPRNELRNTRINTTVMFSDAGLDRLATVDCESLWTAYSSCFRAMNPGGKSPCWMEPTNRSRFAAGNVTLEEAYDHAEFLEVESMIDDLKSAVTNSDEELRNDAIREVLFKYRGNPALVASCADLVGREFVYVSFGVDSTAGETPFDYDCVFEQVGTEFDVQMSVFGEVL